MTLENIKTWINSLPEEFLQFDVVNGEEGDLVDELTYRLDKPIVNAYVDESTKEIVLITDKI